MLPCGRWVRWHCTLKTAAGRGNSCGGKQLAGAAWREGPGGRCSQLPRRYGFASEEELLHMQLAAALHARTYACIRIRSVGLGEQVYGYMIGSVCYGTQEANMAHSTG